jgi:hypothetical protein
MIAVNGKIVGLRCSGRGHGGFEAARLTKRSFKSHRRRHRPIGDNSTGTMRRGPSSRQRVRHHRHESVRQQRDENHSKDTPAEHLSERRVIIARVQAGGLRERQKGPRQETGAIRGGRAMGRSVAAKNFPAFLSRRRTAPGRAPAEPSRHGGWQLTPPA